ncbi:ScbA/BarX family gamma-butyrolactone biosynthesis protein [Streptomyces sp. NRRL B-24085]|uniref:ScbA/BarX family gamma-butyrolactone biosynthesis protein n=1 Tax=Streptomyces sp. NRRL B-24085 TaxID=1709476 RepID=UPI00131CBF5A|nr:ScbA/BarX family gamma-butyrolactone biosynthesis protein [Streptomyces sp. NRRL B-24085]
MVSADHTHKTNQDEVLLRDWRRTGPDTFTVTAAWPAGHRFYVSRLGLHDPLLLSETVRQTLPLLSHGAYQVPFGHQLLWKDFGWTLDPEAARVDGDGGPAELELYITCHEVTYRRDRASAISLGVEVERGGRPLATAHSRFTIQDRTVYNRLRGSYADAAAATARAVPLPPPAGLSPFGRDRFEDVVLAATDRPDHWQLRVDTTHPVLFDHVVDHAPGMLLLEAARQAALATAHPRPTAVTGMESDFVRYAEMDAPCFLHAERLADPGRVRVGARQHDREIFSSVVTLAPASTATATPGDLAA